MHMSRVCRRSAQLNYIRRRHGLGLGLPVKPAIIRQERIFGQSRNAYAPLPKTTA